MPEEILSKIIEFKNFTLLEDGSFTGLASPYGKVDQVGDRVVKGAYTKTISDNNGCVVMLWQHDDAQPIGQMFLSEEEDGLHIKGQLELGLQKAKEAYILLKKKIINGLSIGFKALEKKATDFGRDLLEIKLYEISLVTFPCALEARVSQVKKLRTEGFTEEMTNLQVSSWGYYAIRTLMSCLEDAWYNAGISVDDYWDSAEDPAVIEKYWSDCIDQFKADSLPALKAYMDLTSGMDDDQGKALVLEGRADFLRSLKTGPRGNKAGRRISAETKQKMTDAQGHLDSAKTILGTLLEAEVDDTDKAGGDKEHKNAPVDTGVEAVDDSAMLLEFKAIREILNGNESASQ